MSEQKADGRTARRVWPGRSYRILLLTLVIALQSGGLAAQSVATGLPLLVEETHVVDRFIVLTVRNVDARTMTAWGVRGLVTFDGGVTQWVDMTIDAYQSGFHDESTGKPVVFVPGATVTARIGVRLRDGVVSGVSLVPTAVVLDDGTASGDEQAIETMFAVRARERRACQLIESVLARHLAAVRDPLDAIHLIERDLDGAADDEVRQTRPYSSFRQNLSIAVERASSRQLDLEERLREMQADVRSRRAAADNHYRRR
jgi:hypothetical protein